MQALFDAVNAICAKIQIISNWFWDFPCNLDWYGSIPILGNFSLAIILLVGTGIYFTFRLHFVQVHNFLFAIKVLMQRNHTRNGISSLTAFLLSTAMRVGPGNILGVTGAISIGGPGALFWMWVSAFFGMATSFAESTLSQIFKEKRDNEYVGGLPFYARKLLNDSAAAGVALSMLYIVYALLCFPAQGFNTISAVGAIASKITGVNIPTNSSLYWISFAVLIVITAVISFGGIKKVTKVTDRIVPVMAVIYVLTVIALTVGNIDRIPLFFSSVFTQAFAPDAVFGGAFGLALSQGIKRGLMSNEAGQGTITMPAAAAEVSHPCEQGCVQALGVFLDTIVICTMTGLSIIVSGAWNGDLNGAALTEAAFASAFPAVAKYVLTGGLVLFAFTTIIGWSYYGERCAEYLFGVKCIMPYRIGYIILVGLGVFLKLEMIWIIADIVNGLMAIPNLIALLGLSGVVVAETKLYFEHWEKVHSRRKQLAEIREDLATENN